ncbi:hypothetical protein FisN_36Lh051 [Fistulifera solaris]|uniref:Dynactin 2 n=1 Tax=Fistulifera solaris TaxID=1519565 RepID=A0A1Z5JHT6_FISSO|nr:hypothetical protein FisN_36Lh051 [Fistulifera solaris]|eukprot:GAX13496.1 hypothetical protein FisN_36Lh051 [Fistulifera solaris]
MSTEASHAADQAGGEVIYADDGLEPLAPVKPPPHIQQDVFESVMTTEQAFAIFADQMSHESPIQRLKRLQTELEQLQHELSSETTTMISMDQIQALQEQLQHTRLLQSQRAEQLSSSIELSPVPENSEGKEDGVYVSLEKRLRRLEAERMSQPSIQERLQALEERNKSWDSKQVDALQRKAKTIRQDLEAAAKARSKLNTLNTSSVDNKTLTELYDSLQQVQGFIPHLPALVQRLHALSAQHNEASTWGARLAATEAVAAALQQQLGSAELAFAQLEKSMHENLQQMQVNVKALEGNK